MGITTLQCWTYFLRFSGSDPKTLKTLVCLSFSIQAPLLLTALLTGPRCVVRDSITAYCCSILILGVIRALLFVKCTMSVHAAYFLAVVKWCDISALSSPVW